MDARELRIGNYVTYNNDFFTIKTISKYRVTATRCRGDVEFDYTSIKPIELTEDIFNGIPYTESIHLDQDLKGFRIIANGVDYDFNLKKYPFLHQLQNLYFVLTNEELNVQL